MRVRRKRYVSCDCGVLWIRKCLPSPNELVMGIIGSVTFDARNILVASCLNTHQLATRDGPGGLATHPVIFGKTISMNTTSKGAELIFAIADSASVT